ncbi:MAG: hypothetical protein ACK55Z_37625, partial [bacterium]
LRRRRPTRRSAPPAPGSPRWPQAAATARRSHSAAKHIKNDGSDKTNICVYITTTRPSLFKRGAGEGCI